MLDEDPKPDQAEIGRRLVYFAAERTLMAWVRVALGMMALGFVIDRFGLVVHQIAPPALAHQYSEVFSFWSGSALVVLGGVMAMVAALRYWLFSRDYHQAQSTLPGHGILIGVVFTVIVGLLGFLVAAFLVTVGH